MDRQHDELHAKLRAANQKIWAETFINKILGMESAVINARLNITIRVKGTIGPDEWNEEEEFGDWVRAKIENKEVEYLYLDIVNHKLTQIK